MTLFGYPELMRSHGAYEIELADRVLYSGIMDSWNLETAKAYIDDVLNHGRKLAGRPWAMVNDLRQWGFSGLDLREPIARMAAELDRLDRTHAAVLYSPEHEDLARFIVDTSVGLGSIRAERAFFEALDDALDWLDQAGFDTRAIRSRL